MDKNEYNAKLQEIERYVDQGSNEEASRIADTIDWKRVRNVRTLCMISEIYEAENRYQDSKALLLRAYHRSPVGRAILYRLVEVTIRLKQFDEAIEYYTEYVQAAPHDNNRYILKYEIYRGRGSSLDEQIEILREYLDQEYNEKYAFELAKLYQESGRIKECLAACDDLVLWFHSGKYVLKALELKSRYAQLTPKQQEIYDHRFDEEEQEEEETPVQIGAEKQMVPPTDSSLAETMLQDTEKEIAAELAKAADEGTLDFAQQIEQSARENELKDQDISAAAQAAKNLSTAKDLEEMVNGTVKRSEENAAERETEAERIAREAEEAAKAAELLAQQAEAARKAAQEAAEAARRKESEKAMAESARRAAEAAREEAIAAAKAKEEEEKAEAERKAALAEALEKAKNDPVITDKAPEELQKDVAEDVRSLVSGIADRSLVDEDEEAINSVIEKSKKEQEESTAAWGAQENDAFRRMQEKLRMPQKRQSASVGKLTIDDILLSMGEKGDAVRQAATQAVLTSRPKPTGVLSAVDEALLNMTGKKPVDQLDALEKIVDRKNSEDGVEVAEIDEADEIIAEHTQPQPAQDLSAQLKEAFAPEEEETVEETADDAEIAETAETDKEETEKVEDTMTEEEILSAKTRRIPTEEIKRIYESMPIGAKAEDVLQAVADAAKNEANVPAEDAGVQEPEAVNENTDDTQADAVEETAEDADAFAPEAEETAEDADAFAPEAEETAQDADAFAPEDGAEHEAPAGTEEITVDHTEEAPKNNVGLKLHPAHRDLFAGFLQIRDLESQIAGAIARCLNKGEDKTSRTGNVLIFGGHGCGKSTIAVGLAKAIAAERGDATVKMARIYATDLNRKDIAATIAKIAGGILIIEEAGDLQDSTCDQLTTAMEFRTDGLIVIMEDEQRYMHELLMRHPRFTMKFTSQITIPTLTTEEMVDFCNDYAQRRGYVMGESSFGRLSGRLNALIGKGEAISLANLRDFTDEAMRKANKFGRKMFAGKKRFDEQGRIILTEKDFR